MNQFDFILGWRPSRKGQVLFHPALEAENIEARPVWKPMHMQPVFNPQISQISTDSEGKKKYPCRVVGGEMAEDLFERGLCLPSGTAMTNSDLDRVIDTILSCRFR
ncbi:unnamed protein product [marine sediment metagenome]|uniref:DegT/DnrJ/EryC1/StrS aminotransferase n=1 Tax=marine sediment metagenome TaxID=412755 RepID=X1NAH7_9ZZZZ